MDSQLGTPVLYENRRLYPVYLEGGGIIMTYSASRTEAERIANRYGNNSVITYGEDTYVILGAYSPNNSNFLPSESGRDQAILNGISNNDLSNKIRQDRNLYTTVNRVNQPALPDPNQPGTPGTSVPSPNPSPNSPQNKRTTFTPLTYPSDMSSEQDRIKFTAVELNPRTNTTGGIGEAGFGDPSYSGPVDGPVYLAVQAGITDQNSVDWGPDSVNAINAYLYSKSLEIMQSDNPNQPLAQMPKDILNASKKYKSFIEKFLAGQAAGINNVLARTDNVVLNPNLELLFQGPQLRPFSFQFKLSARNQKEADEIKKIIKFFKKNMAVKKEGLFLKAPNVFKIKYEKAGGDHPGLNLISPDNAQKACALTNCSVDYTPLGTYMTYNDGTMVAYTLSLQFQELTPVYASDYTGHPIGY